MHKEHAFVVGFFIWPYVLGFPLYRQSNTLEPGQHGLLCHVFFISMQLSGFQTYEIVASEISTSTFEFEVNNIKKYKEINNNRLKQVAEIHMKTYENQINS